MLNLPYRALRLLPPETAHGVAIRALEAGLAPKADAAAYPSLRTSLFGLDFPNPVGLAAGFDKNADAPDALLGLGFGFVEVGTITPLPQPGNLKPRMFRDPASQSLVNRLGFNGRGLEVAGSRLRARQRRGIVGANVGKNKQTVDAATDYAACIARLACVADYLTINISSPNTPGLRDLQEASALDRLLAACVEARDAARRECPLLVKIAPDLDAEALRALVEVAIARRIDALIIGNTTLSRPAGLPQAFTAEAGGLSGRPLFALSTAQLRAAFRLAEGRIPLIGVGGISSGADAYEKIRAGASLVQLYTGMIYGGRRFVPTLLEELAACLAHDGHATIGAATGCRV